MIASFLYADKYQADCHSCAKGNFPFPFIIENWPSYHVSCILVSQVSFGL